MKEPIEQIVKKSLEQHEMPYNASAWTSMQAKLDAKATPPASNWKYFGAAGIAIIAVSSYFFFNGEDQVTSQQLAQTNQSEKVITTEGTTSQSTSVKEKTTPNASTTNSVDGDSSLESMLDETVTLNGINNLLIPEGLNEISETTLSTNTHKVTVASTELIKNDPKEKSGSEVTTNRPSMFTNISIPEINNLCLGQKAMMLNKNEKSLFVKEPNGQEFELIGNSSSNYKSSQIGSHFIGHYHGTTFIELHSFIVNEVPTPDFSIDLDTKFKDGLPTTHVEATSLGESFMWNAEGQIIHGETADIHFYEEGLHKLTLEVSNGECKAHVEKQINVEQYNLLAMNAFNPNSSDFRNSTFMPFALTLRNTRFQMIIIDSRDGGVVYETSDANLPWDGIDKRTGKIESTVNTYIWKVTLENPELGEPTEYKGTIIKL